MDKDTKNVWMGEEEIELIERHLKPDFSMLEYGCGGSTLHFSRLVKNYYSIESNNEWADKILNQSPENVNMVLSLPEATEDVIKICEREMKEREDYSWDTLFNTSFYRIFKEYINSHEHFNSRFDAVLIDGRARQHCARAVHGVIDENAVVFVHDFFSNNPVSQRTMQHKPILEKYKIIDQVESGQTIVALKKK
jgi:hypothetical protein